MKKALIISILLLTMCLVATVNHASAVSTGLITTTPESLIVFLFLIGGIPIAINHYRKNHK